MSSVRTPSSVIALALVTSSLAAALSLHLSKLFSSSLLLTPAPLLSARSTLRISDLPLNRLSSSAFNFSRPLTLTPISLILAIRHHPPLLLRRSSKIGYCHRKARYFLH